MAAELAEPLSRIPFHCPDPTRVTVSADVLVLSLLIRRPALLVGAPAPAPAPDNRRPPAADRRPRGHRDAEIGGAEQGGAGRRR